MFLYTPKREILQTLYGDLEGFMCWSKAQKVLQKHRIFEYSSRVAFYNGYLKTVFYSKTEREFVPVLGYLFSVDLFDVREV